jgi:hypothetical protein
LENPEMGGRSLLYLSMGARCDANTGVAVPTARRDNDIVKQVLRIYRIYIYITLVYFSTYYYYG